MNRDMHTISLPDHVQCLHQLVEYQAHQNPSGIALEFENISLSYKELNDTSDRLSLIIQQKFSQETILGLSTNRGTELIIGLLAILKSGKGYLPLDATYPIERLRQVITDSGVKTCLAAHGEQSFFRQLGLDFIASDKEHEATNNSSNRADSSDLACILYTSGSTGVPKGVCLEHAGLMNLVRHRLRRTNQHKHSRFLQFAHLSFDASILDIFYAFGVGGTLVLIDDEIRLDGHRLLHFIEERSVNRIHLPFVALQYLTEAADMEKKYPACLSEVMTGGEQLKISPQIRRFFGSLPFCVFVNSYGPTEASVTVTEYEFDDNPNDWAEIPPIGRPVLNTDIFILDESSHLLPNGATGELFISGISLATGYFNKPELTSEKFIDWQHPERGWLRIYRSGDLAHYGIDGNIAFEGRRDNQVKIRGYRVELGEIEVAIMQAEGVKQAVVTMREDLPGNKQLVAYLVGADSKNSTTIRKVLEQKLPDFMMPSAFVWLNDLPKTVSGKVDRKALPKPEYKRPDIGTLYKAPSTPLEQEIIGLWLQLLQLDRIGVNDNFFEIGGNSLLAVKTIAALKQKGFNLAVTKLYQFPTATKIAHYLDNKLGDKSANQTKKNTASEDHEIAVIGMALRFSGISTPQEYWALLRDGREAINFFSDHELDSSISGLQKNDPDYVKARGVVGSAKNFDAPFFGINSKYAELMDPQQRIFLEISWEALESAGYGFENNSSSIGVFAGCDYNSYYINNVLPNKALVENAGALQLINSNDKDYISSRVSYCLNLRGPAVTVQSACSTSLLAIAQAVESIRSGQCEMALAGGVNIKSPSNTGHLYQEGAILSKDGHCRPFDIDATGTTFSDGAGVVLLKSKRKAEEDGDIIYGIIKGVGVNNDGGGKGSFMAPNSEGQAGAIKMAIENAGVDAETISYIEAHGTATPIGDPIEIEGLNIAFEATSKKQFCAIGSVKGNLGHPSAAAGVAGFIKTVLALYHKQIPPSINYTSPNPAINFHDSPFFVNNNLQNWRSDEVRRAGVSSFGVGGTNVHTVLEEYIDSDAKDDFLTSKPFHLLAWSAKNEISRDEYAPKLAQFIKANGDVHIADVAHSLHHYKQDFSSRRFLIAADCEQATNKLQNLFTNPETKTIKELLQEVIFMFPGQGSQYPNMGRELYAHEPVFRKAVDDCSEILREYLGEDIRNTIFVDAANNEAEEKLKDTFYAQPSLFTIEYALAQLWLSWGVRPSAFVGHSVGEFVAAHLAGVFSLKDALKLVAGRGKLMSAMPRGSMLSVRTEFAKLEALLPDNISIAAINSPGLCVVAGCTDEIERFSAKLNEQGIPNKLLHTSHAFHSLMMEPAIEPFREIVKTVKLSTNKIPIFSTVTGAMLTASDAVDENYWSTHLRATVRFADAIKKAGEGPRKLFLEVGPKNVTAVLARQQFKNHPIVASLETSETLTNEYQALLKALGQVWLQGLEVNWTSYYQNEKRKKLVLPTYAFDSKPCWIEPPQVEQQQEPVRINNSDTQLPENLSSVQTPLMRKETIIIKVREVLEHASGLQITASDTDANFIEIGFDSLLLTQVAISLKKEFNVPVTFRMLNEAYCSIGSLAAFLDSQLPAHLYQPEIPETKVKPAKEQPIIQAQTQTFVPNDSALGLIAQQLEILAKQIAIMQGGAPSLSIQNIQQHAASVPAPAALKEQPALTPEEEKEIKKPFGATARIDRQATKLTDTQQKFLNDLTNKYVAKTKKSKEYTQKHRAYMADPRVVTGFKPMTKELVYPVVINQSKGCRVWDLDGNEYVDALNGFGSNMLGYKPDFIKKALHDQIEKGFEVGPQHDLSGEVCKLVCEFTKFDRAALCNTGSEAVMGAMRIARTVTGRSLIVAFAGSYHGIFDEVVVRGTKKLKTFPAASGIMPEAVQNMLILEYGTDESLAIIRERAHELAAVLVEPVQSRRPDFQPIEFLKHVRKITAESGTALVFDEVITGFRMHPGGAQALFGIKADLATYGKVIGGGISIGIIAGTKSFMDALDGGYWQYGDESIPEVGVTYFAGTFVRHPLALATTKASLEYMKAKGPALQEGVNAKTKRLADAINQFCSEYDLPVHVVSFGSLWKILFKKEILCSELLFTLMRYKGVHIQDLFPCYMTEPHTEEDINFIIQAFKESISELIEAEIIPVDKDLSSQIINGIDENPPLPGARLGRDRDGNPAWFIEDPQSPGKYLQLELHQN